MKPKSKTGRGLGAVPRFSKSFLKRKAQDEGEQKRKAARINRKDNSRRAKAKLEQMIEDAQSLESSDVMDLLSKAQTSTQIAEISRILHGLEPPEVIEKFKSLVSCLREDGWGPEWAALHRADEMASAFRAKHKIESNSSGDMFSALSVNVQNAILDCVESIASTMREADSPEKVRHLMHDIKLLVAGSGMQSTLLADAERQSLKAKAFARVSPFLKLYFTNIYEGSQSEASKDLSALWTNPGMFDSKGFMDYEWDATFRGLIA